MVSVGGVLVWMACQRGLRASVGDVGGVPARGRWLVCWHGWRTKVSSVNDSGGMWKIR